MRCARSSTNDANALVPRALGYDFLDVMQDDLGFAALPVQVGDVIRTMVPVVTEQYGIQVSMDTRVEDEAVVDGPPPNNRVLYTGADFECAGVGRHVRRGQDKSITRCLSGT
jgi:hypothetical protein